jgi:phosphoribosylaminoimidazole-succinocarboxamide synthase
MEKRMDKLQFKRNSQDEGWFSELTEVNVEIHVPGSDEGPDEAAVELVNEALTDLAGLKLSAQRYFLEYLDEIKVKINTEASLLFIHSGYIKDIVKLEFGFDNDTYGLWFIEFALQPELLRKKCRFWPITFGRRSW